jgi:hypothetical protein
MAKIRSNPFDVLRASTIWRSDRSYSGSLIDQATEIETISVQIIYSPMLLRWSVRSAG